MRVIVAWLMLALILIRVTQNWPSNRLLRDTQVEFQQWNTHSNNILVKKFNWFSEDASCHAPHWAINVDMILFCGVVETNVDMFTDDVRT